MGQIVSTAAKPKRCNKNQLSQLGVLAAGLHVLVSSDNSMNAAGQGNFDCYIVGNGRDAATALELKDIDNGVYKELYGGTAIVSIQGTATAGFRITQSGGIKSDATAASYSLMVYPIESGKTYTLTIPKVSNNYCALFGFRNIQEFVDGSVVADFTYIRSVTNYVNNNVSSDTYPYLVVCFETSYGEPTLQTEAAQEGLVDKVASLEDSVTASIAGLNNEIGEVKTELYVTDKYTPSALVQDKYYKYNGDGNAVTLTNSANFKYVSIPISAGDKITAYFNAASNQNYYRGWYLVDSNYIILQTTDATFVDHTTNPLLLTATQNGYFIVNFDPSHTGQDLDVSVERDEKQWERGEQELQAQIDVLDEIVGTETKIIIPDVVYGIVGTQMNLWNDTIAISADKGLHSPINYRVVWMCAKGLVTDRCFRFEPSSSDVGDHSCTCYVYNNAGTLIAEKTFVIRVVANTANLSAKKTVLFGDSLGAGTALQLYNNFQSPSQFAGNMPAMLGSRDGEGYSYEATGGYGWSEYATEGRAAFRISVTGVTSVGEGAIYSDTSSHYFEVREVNITNGNGNILLIYALSHVGVLVMPSGTLTKISGSGDDTIPYTGAFQESANLLWNNGALDFANYRTAHLGLSSSEKLDAVFFQLGINGATSIEQIKTYINSIYDAFVADNPNGLFVVGLTPTSGNDVNGAGANYGASYDTEAYHKRVFERNLLYLELLQDTTRPNYRVSPQALFIDRYYGYSLGSRAISSRVSTTELYHVNFVHPTTSGYQQLADGLLGAYVALLSE